MKNNDLQRFIDAQNPVFDTVQHELKNAKKVSHWMWYIFPQIKGLGLSATSQFYAIADKDEAVDYLQHPILGQRLIACCQILLSYSYKTAEQIFGSIDSVKLKSSMTLFNAVVSQSGLTDNVFARVLDQYFDGEQDSNTLNLLGI